MLDENQNALELTQAIHAAGRQILRNRRLPPSKAGSTPLLNIAIAIGPSGIQLDREIDLVKSALLYADHVSLCSPTYEMLACMAALAQSDTETQLRFLANIYPMLAPSQPLVAAALRQLIDMSRRRTRDELIALTQLRRALPQHWKPLADRMNAFYEEAHAGELQEPLRAGLLDLDFLELGDTTTNEVVNAFTKRISEYLKDAGAYPMFDDGAGDIARLGLKAGIFTTSSVSLRRASDAALGTGLIDRLPSFPSANMKAVLETRNEVEEHVGRFRRAVAKMREGISSTALEPDFAGHIDKVFVSEVRAAVEEIQSALDSSSLGKRLLALGNKQVGAAALALGVFQLVDLPVLIKLGVTGIAAGVAAGAGWQATSKGKEQAQGNDLFFLYRTELELDERSS